MEWLEAIDKLPDGLRHLRIRTADEIEKYKIPSETVPRPGFNTTGKEIEVSLNAYPITKFPSRRIYQYDVQIGNGAEKTAVIKKVWDSSARKNALKSIIFDGQKLAWTLQEYKQGLNVMVDLDAEQNRKPGAKPNVFRLLVRPTKTVDLSALNLWLQGRTDMSENVLQALNFLDHVLRETPSNKYVAIKRSFFDPEGASQDLGKCVYAFKGVYQAIRPALNRGLIVNIDVSNTCFWSRCGVMQVAIAVLDARDIQEVIHRCEPVSDKHGGTTESPGFYEVHRKLKKLVVQAHYKGCPCTGVNFTIKGLVNGNARQYMLDIKDKATGKIDRMSVEQYFKKKYNIFLDFPELPMVEMTKKGVLYPMELLTIHGFTRYPWKLNEFQTAAMIRYCASRPAERLNSIVANKKMMDHTNDPVLSAFGLQVDPNMIRGKARLLPSPDIHFGANQRHNPGTNGRWDLRGKKFYQTNRRPLEHWGVGYFVGKRGSANKAQVEAFCDGLMKAYAGHGGQVARRPVIVELKEDIGEAVKKLHEIVNAKCNVKSPQLLIFVVPNKDSFAYLRIKKSCDCRFGVPSQCVLASHVMKGNPQYYSNVLMKVNAKLGGTTARVVSKVSGATLKPNSMIIGADVTHSPMGVWSPSMAAVSVCMDNFGGRYFGACEANGDRVEIINRANLEIMLTPLIREWMSTVGQGRAPEHVYYFRDGVSTGQFEHVLQSEVFDMKSIFMKLTQDRWPGKFTVVVANKRHHLRAFPRPGDRNAADKNGNPLPGTLIEKDVTSPHDWDFLLYSHIALQGTSCPVHYHVILDQIGHKAHELENLIYDHCYQYMRSTTSVSLHPAVYYAHLIAARARHHEDVAASSGPQSGPTVKLTNPKPEKRPVDPRLLPMVGNMNRLPFSMWYI
ncbi:putative eukaryotic translation initiation factor eIF-2C4 [Aspergillus saccharolyticus JOP 1030-1]|uniref:Eukaryotic translation initiation factor 2c n=1 Tax=Aspergillus saccharolyticus JOP 1030-1 TaxID=1450539 RepID=A0A318Z4P8_9EURO|nr:eukaryotic translation initiation factor 2c [Aspergillus saccharolyticus JOP 1030-1]PYH41337.1 eukaryotic translation initiation factor 2c [Aspergillus saccharolyticus JOP 1030-1]